MDPAFILGFLLAVFVLSYLVGDNFLYRLAMHILVGVGAAYVVAIAVSQVLYPGIVLRVNSPDVGDKTLGLFGVLGCVFLLAKLLPRVAWLGNVAVGYLIGVGAGVAIGGALFGTLVPQSVSAAVSLNPAAVGGAGSIANLLILVATVTTLLSFAYARAAQRGLMGALGRVGRAFLYIALGATFALVFVAGASVLSGWARDMLIGFGIVEGP